MDRQEQENNEINDEVWEEYEILAWKGIAEDFFLLSPRILKSRAS